MEAHNKNDNLTKNGYQLKLLLFFLQRGIQTNKIEQFYILTDEETDDIHLYLNNKNDGRMQDHYIIPTFLDDESKLSNEEDIVNKFDKTTKCKLKKYFIMYRKFKQQGFGEEIKRMYLCGNNFFDETSLTNNLMETSKAEDISDNSEIIKKEWPNYCMQFLNTCNEMKESLMECTNLNLLATELVNYILKKRSNETDSYWISSYFNAMLKENVIEGGVYKLPLNQKLKSKNFENFMKAFTREIRLKTGGKQEHLKKCCYEKNFIEKLLKKTDGNNTASIEEIAKVLSDYCIGKIEQQQIPSKNYDKLAEFVTLQKEYKFSQAFIEGDNLSLNAQEFRKIVFQIFEKEIIKNLQNREFYSKNAFKNIPMCGTSKYLCKKNQDKVIAAQIIDYLLNNSNNESFPDILPEYQFLKDVFEVTGLNDTFKFSKKFLNQQCQQEFYGILMELYATSILKNCSFDSFVSNLSILAKEFRRSFDEIKEDKDKTLKLCKNAKFDDVLKALNGSAFLLSTTEMNIVEFVADFFQSATNQKNPLAETFSQEMKKMFTEEELNALQKFEYSNYPPYFNELKNHCELSQELEEFCQILNFIKTPETEEALLKAIEFEMNEKLNFLNLESVACVLHEKILKWLKENENMLLTKNDAMKFINSMESEITEMLKRGCTEQYLKMLKSCSIEFNRKFQTLQHLLSTPKQILHIQSNEILLTELKVAAEMAEKNQEKTIIFNNLCTLLKMEYLSENGIVGKYISKAFESTAVELLITADDEEITTEENLESFCKTLYEILKNNEMKKIVIIANENSRFIEVFKSRCISTPTPKSAPASTSASMSTPMSAPTPTTTSTEDMFASVLHDTTNLQDLTPNSIKHFLKKAITNFQGIYISLNEIIDENEASKFFDPKVLQKMMFGKSKFIVVGNPVPDFTKLEKNCYRPRKIYLNVISDNIFWNKMVDFDGYRFVIEGDKNDLTKIIESKTTKKINVVSFEDFIGDEKWDEKCKIIQCEKGAAKEQFKQICQKSLNSIVHWMEIKDDLLLWRHSFSSPTASEVFQKKPSIIERYQKSVNEAFLYEQFPEHNVLIIVEEKDVIGGGCKLFTRLAQKISKESNKGTRKWIIRIKINSSILLEIKKKISTNEDYDNDDSELFFDFNENFDHKNAIDYSKLIMKHLAAKNQKPIHSKKLSFENQIFNHFFKAGKMIFIFDDLEPLTTEYGKEILYILQKLQNKNQIWISTSNNNFAKVLEEKFKTFSYHLEPQTRYDQKIFLKNNWLNKWKAEKGDEMPNQDQLEKYVIELVDEFSYLYKNIIEFSLQTKMLAELFFQENFNEKQLWQCYFKGDTVTKLYENLLKVIMRNLHITDIAEIEKEKHTYQIFGMITVFDKYKTLLSEDENQTIKTWISNFKKGLKNSSITSNLNSADSPIFNHFTYAQYFAACYCFDKLTLSPLNNAEEIFKFYDESLVKDIPIFRRVFISKIKTFFIENVLQEEHLLNFVARHGLLNYAILLLDNALQRTSESFYEDCENYDLLLPTSEEDLYYYGSRPFIPIRILQNAIKNAKTNVGIYIILFVYRRLLSNNDYNETPLYYLSKLVASIDNISDSAVFSFIEDIKRASMQQCLIPKNKMKHFFLGLSKSEENERDRNLRRRNDKFSSYKANEIKLKILHSDFSSINWEIFSYESIKSILIHLKPPIFSRWGDGFFQSICTSSLMTDKEKVKLFELFLNDSSFSKETIFHNKRDDYMQTCLNSIIDNDCGEIMNHLLANKNIIIDNKILIKTFEHACKMNVPEVVIAMLTHINEKEELLFECIATAFFEKSSLNTIKAIFEFPKIPINLLSADNGSTFLHTAIEKECNHKIIDYLLSKGADPNIADEDGKTAWMCAIEKADDKIIQIFLSKLDKTLGSKIEVIKEYFKNSNIFDANLIINGKTRLHQAIIEKNIELCIFLIRKGANIHASFHGKTPISYACENELYEVVKWLLYNGASYDDESITVEKIKNTKIQEILQETKYIFTEMQCKEFRVSDCERSHYIDMEPPVMTKMKYIRNATNKYQQTLWHIAAKSGFFLNIRQFEYDFDFQKTINSQDIYGNTALHYAVQSNKKHSVRFLLNMGAYYDIANKNDEIPRDLATIDEIKEIFKKIDKVFSKSANEKVDYLNVNEEYHSLKICDVQNKEGKTLLHYAVINNNMPLFKQLIQPSSKNIKDINGYAPLFYAVKEGKFEMMKKLIGRNAIFVPKLYNNLDKNECTEYLQNFQRRHFLVCDENVEELKAELKSYKDNHELNIITRAVYLKDYETPKIESKLDPRWGEEMKTIWDYAAISYELMLYLLQNGIAASGYNVKNLRINKMISLLGGIQRFIKEIDQDTLINYCEGYVINRILYLLNPNGKNNCTRNDIDKTLANFRIYSIFSRDEAHTLLHLAAISNKEKIVKWLIKEKGADPYEKDWKNQDTYELAKKYNSEEVLQILQSLEEKN